MNVAVFRLVLYCRGPRFRCSARWRDIISELSFFVSFKTFTAIKFSTIFLGWQPRKIVPVNRRLKDQFGYRIPISEKEIMIGTTESVYRNVVPFKPLEKIRLSFTRFSSASACSVWKNKGLPWSRPPPVFCFMLQFVTVFDSTASRYGMDGPGIESW